MSSNPSPPSETDPPVSTRRFVVLLVEDREMDRLAARKAIASAGFLVDYREAYDGRHAVQMIERGLRPDIILLDLNMPRMSGMEFLTWIRGKDEYAFPVIVLTGVSTDPRTVRRAYTLGASGFTVKPLGRAPFTELVRNIAGYWFGVVQLP